MLRYGIGNGINYTLDQIGNYYGLTRERIRQIEKRALKRMKTYLSREIKEEKGLTKYL